MADQPLENTETSRHATKSNGRRVTDTPPVE
jgi:hypothetical protein